MIIWLTVVTETYLGCMTGQIKKVAAIYISLPYKVSIIFPSLKRITWAAVQS